MPTVQQHACQLSCKDRRRRVLGVLQGLGSPFSPGRDFSSSRGVAECSQTELSRNGMMAGAKRLRRDIRDPARQPARLATRGVVPVAVQGPRTPRGRASAPCPARRPQLDRAQELLGDFSRFWKAEPTPPSAASSSAGYRSRLTGRRHDRGGQATASLRRLLQSSRSGESAAGEQKSASGPQTRAGEYTKKARRRGSNPRLSPRRSRFGYNAFQSQPRRCENWAGVSIGNCWSGKP